MSFYRRLAQLEREGTVFALVTVIQSQGSVPRHAGSKMLVFQDGSSEGSIGGGEMEGLAMQEALKAMETGEPKVLHYEFRDPEKGDPGVCGGEVDVYVEPVHPRPKLLIFGAGHVGKAVAHLGDWLGFRVIIADDRQEMTWEEGAEIAESHIPCELADLADKVKIDQQTYMVLTTRGVPVDVEGLPSLLKSGAAYIGVIGSRRRWETAARQLLEAGEAKEDIARVTSPMGIELNAETPEEIAVSVIAEILMIHRGGGGGRMAHTPTVLKVHEGE
jgi:xanthine dehydrogenase accessory factor